MRGRDDRSGDLGRALAALDAPALRALIEEVLPRLEDAARTQLSRQVIERAASVPSGPLPPAVSKAEVAEALDFVRSARLVPITDPAEVDALLRRATDAFVRRDYATSRSLFAALLPPIGDVEIDLGQDDLPDDVLDVDLEECAARHAVAVWMTGEADGRAAAVWHALRETETVWYPDAPLREMERVALEPLPDLERFLDEWSALLTAEVAAEPRGGWGGGPRAWLREAVERAGGPASLADLARASGDAEDFRSWIGHLVRGGDWRSVLDACDEAAERAVDAHDRADFLDAAARCAQELGRRDVAKRLERAWRVDAAERRLLRWLGVARSQGALRARARKALDACPKRCTRQRAILHVLSGHLEAAVGMLASAPARGWSDAEHAGTFLFALSAAWLDGTPIGNEAFLFDAYMSAPADLLARLDELDDAPLDEPADALYRLVVPTPALPDLLERAGISSPASTALRRTLADAMKRAAARRLAAVVKGKHRRRYGHAATLVATVVACDPSPDTEAWAAGLRQRYRRYPALSRQLDERIDRP